MSSSSILETIKGIVTSHDVVLFMKGKKESPVCGFSSAVVQILNVLQVDFFAINVLESNEMRQGIKDYTDWPTIPQLYVKGSFIGGCDIVSQMFKSGELTLLLKAKEVL